MAPLAHLSPAGLANMCAVTGVVLILPTFARAAEGTTVSEHHEPSAAIFFLVLALLIGVLFRRVLSGFWLPYTALLLLSGLLIGVLDQHVGWNHIGEGVTIWKNMPPTIFLFLFLPIILFAAGMSMDWHTFYRQLHQILILAYPGVAINVCLVAVVYKYVFPYDWTWKEAFLYGAIISATDSVAVMAMLKLAGAPQRLGHLIEGESLMNDGSAFVMFLIFFDMVKGGERSPGHTVGYFVKLLAGALAVGSATGTALSLFLVKTYRDSITEIIATVIAAYLCFWIGEDIVHVSGVLSVVVLAVFMAAVGKRCVSPDTKHALHIVWEVLDFTANTLVFVYAGIVIAKRTYAGSSASDGDDAYLVASDWGWAVVNWLLLNVIRFTSIALLKPFLTPLGDGFTWADAMLVTWAALRGSLGLVLALLVELESNTNPLVNNRFASLMVFFVGTTSVLTILVQGSTVPAMLHALGLMKQSPAQLHSFIIAATEVEEYPDKHLAHLKSDELLGAPDWDEVLMQSSLDITPLLPSKKALLSMMRDTNISRSKADLSEYLNLERPSHPPRPEPAAPPLVCVSVHEAAGSSWEELGEMDGKLASTNELQSVSAAAEATLPRAESRATVDWEEEPTQWRWGLPVAVVKVARQAPHRTRRSLLRARRKRHKDMMHDATTAADILRNVQLANKEDELSNHVTDMRARYLAAMKAVYTEGLEKGHLNGEQHAALIEMADQSLDRVNEPLRDWQGMRRHVSTAQLLRMFANACIFLGRYIPGLASVGNQVMFASMQSSLRMVSAFVYAHDQSKKGMYDVAYLELEVAHKSELDPHTAQDRTSLVRKAAATVIEEGSVSQRRAAEELAAFKSDYPEVVRAIKTRDTAHTILLHKARFVNELMKAGLLKGKEANSIQDLIHQKLKHLYFNPAKVEFPDPETTIKAHPLFNHMHDAAIKRLFASGRLVVHPARKTIFERGGVVSSVQFVVRGSVARYSDDPNSVHVAGVGAALGLMEMLASRPRQRSVSAETAVVALKLSKREFLDLMASDPQVELKAYQLAAAYLCHMLDTGLFADMSHDELAREFKDTELLDLLTPDATLTLAEPAFLMTGAVTGQARKLPKAPLNRVSLALNRVSFRMATEQDTEKRIEAPSGLEPGTYTVLEESRVVMLPGDIRQRPLDDKNAEALYSRVVPGSADGPTISPRNSKSLDGRAHPQSRSGSPATSSKQVHFAVPSTRSQGRGFATTYALTHPFVPRRSEEPRTSRDSQGESVKTYTVSHPAAQRHLELFSASDSPSVSHDAAQLSQAPQPPTPSSPRGRAPGAATALKPPDNPPDTADIA